MAGVSTEIIHHVSLEESERFTRDLPTGRTKIDTIKVRHFQGHDSHIEVQGFLIKKDGMVGNARRHGDINLDDLPEALQAVVEPLL